MTGENDAQGIAECFRTFIETFNSADGAAMAGSVGYPYMMGGSGQVPQTIPDEEAGRKFFGNAFKQLKSLGWERTRIDRLDAVSAGGDTGVISTDFSRHREDGIRLDSGSGHYIARRFDGQWKIVAAIFSDNGLFSHRS